MGSYWIDTLVLKTRGKYLRYSAASSLPLRGKPTQAQDVARRISGAVTGEVHASQDLTPDNEPFLAPLILLSLLSIYIIKIPKIFILLLLLSLSDLTLVSDREGIDNP